MKIPKAKALTKKVLDSYMGRGASAIRDGVIDGKLPKAEESDKLNLKIDVKKK